MRLSAVEAIYKLPISSINASTSFFIPFELPPLPAAEDRLSMPAPSSAI